MLWSSTITLATRGDPFANTPIDTDAFVFSKSGSSKNVKGEVPLEVADGVPITAMIIFKSSVTKLIVCNDGESDDVSFAEMI